jgi:hypothetical protein
MTKRKGLSTDVRTLVLHECGYRCANPICRMVLTLEIHHLEQVAEGGTNDAYNLLPLCPNCHTLHHRGIIPIESLRSWKHLALALSHAFDARLVDLLLTLQRLGRVWVSGDGVLQCSPGVASGLIKTEAYVTPNNYVVSLTDKGKRFVDAWLAGNERDAIGAVETSSSQ